MKRHLAFFLLVSFFIHCLFFFLFSKYIPYSLPQPISIEISEDSPDEKTAQIVEQYQFNRQTPKDRFYFSRHNNTTDKEYKGKAGNNQQAHTILKQDESSSIVLETSPFQVLYGNIDDLEDVEQTGDQNSLNTKEILFYTFYSRVKHQVYWHWIREIQSELEHIPIRPPARGRLTTHIEAFLDSKGYLNSIVVKKKSGLDGLDRASINAVQKAHPFPNPPAPLVSDKGTFRLKHIFVLLNDNDPPFTPF